MAHNIDMTNGRANMAFLGDRADIWHRMGQQMPEGAGVSEWAKAAGLAWAAIKVPAVAALTGPEFAHIASADVLRQVEDRKFIVRSDNGRPLGYVSDQYQPVQPAEVLEWFQHYIAVDERFELDVAGSLKNGEIIWATASFQGDLAIVGEQHKARLLMTTTFDGSGSTTNKATMTRVVCNNTLDAAMMDPRATVRTRHSTKFQPERARTELEKVAAGFVAYKQMAEAMVAVLQSAADVSGFFKAMLDIPFDAKAEDISGRKMNQFGALRDAYKATVAEGTAPMTGWTALNAITRWVDHDRSTRGGENATEARVLSANFGSGAALKAKAIGLLLPDFKPREKVAA